MTEKELLVKLYEDKEGKYYVTNRNEHFHSKGSNCKFIEGTGGIGNCLCGKFK